MSEVKFVRVYTGEDVLCTITEHDDHIVMEDPVVVIPTQQETVQFVPYSPFTDPDESIKLDKKFVVFIQDPRKDLKDHYKKLFSKIITADNSIVS